MSVEVKALTKIYGEQRAVDAISFSINRGEIVGFLGPNGAGKSTTMKMITGYLAPDDGEIVVSGIDVKKSFPSHQVRREQVRFCVLIDNGHIYIRDDRTNNHDTNRGDNGPYGIFSKHGQ